MWATHPPSSEAIGKRSDPTYVICGLSALPFHRLSSSLKRNTISHSHSPGISRAPDGVNFHNFHYSSFLFSIKPKNKNKYIFLFYFNLLCSYTHTHSCTRAEKLGRSLPERQTWQKRETECPRRGGGEQGRRGGGREREVLNGTPKPLRGSVGKVTWPELGPFYIRRQPNLSFVWTVRYFVDSDFFSFLFWFIIYFIITSQSGRRWCVLWENKIEQRDFYVHRSVMRL